MPRFPSTRSSRNHRETAEAATAERAARFSLLAAAAAAVESDEDMSDIGSGTGAALALVPLMDALHEAGDGVLPNLEGQDIEDLSGSKFFSWRNNDDYERIAQETLEWIPLLFPHHSIFSASMEELSALKNDELKAELKFRGLTTSGNKSQLISHLEKGLEQPN